MKTLKKTLCLVLAVVMAVGVLILPANAAFTDEADITKDYKTAVTALVNYGILQGKKNGDELKIDPLGDVTRAEVATMTYRLLTGDTTGDYVSNYVNYAGVFSDVTADWQRGPVGFCANGKLVVGIGDGKYAPNAPVTGYELLAIMLRALGYGQLGEFTGAKWKENTYAQAVKSGLDAGVEKTDLSKNLSREKVAQIIYNTIGASRVVYTPGFGYTYVNENPLDTENGFNDSLIEVGVIDDEGVDSWGAPKGFTHNYEFTWPVVNIEDDWFQAISPIKTYYEAVTECDVADDIEGTVTSLAKVNGKQQFVTFNNGKDNKGVDTIQATDEINSIGAQGRETIIYAYTNPKTKANEYRIVYKDVVLAKVIGVAAKQVDAAGHVIKNRTLTVRIYANDVMQGLNGASFKATAKADYKDITVENDTYNKGDIITGYILTTTPGNTLGKTGVSLSGLAKANVATVKIAGIKYSENGTAIGFVDDQGNSYLYGVTYGYNTVANVKNGISVAPLKDGDIGKTVSVYLTSLNGGKDDYGNYTVLGLAPNGTVPTVGVVADIKEVTVAYDKNGKALLGLELTILTTDGPVTITTIGNDDSTPDQVAPPRPDKYQLVAFETNKVNTKYYNVYTAVHGVYPITRVMAGDADALGGPLLVNDNTLFFVATYKMSNSKGAYVTDSYEIYKGFKNIPDLKCINARVLDSDNDKAVVPERLEYYYFLAKDENGNNTDYASCVLITKATEDSTNKTHTVPKYAYIDYTRSQHTVYDEKYTFNVYLNGVAGTMDVANGTAGTVVSNGNGLYIYDELTRGTAAIVGKDVVNKIDADTNGWTYTDGVIALDKAVNLDGTAITDKYLTVVDDPVIYIVNPTNGKCTLSVYTDLNDIKAIYAKADLYFQLNEYGYVDLVYVVSDRLTPETDPADPPTKYTAETINVTFTSEALANTNIYKLGFWKTLSTRNYDVVYTASGGRIVTIASGESLIVTGVTAAYEDAAYAVKVGSKWYPATVDVDGIITVPVAAILKDMTLTSTTANITITDMSGATAVNIYKQAVDKVVDVAKDTPFDVDYLIWNEGTLTHEFKTQVKLISVFDKTATWTAGTNYTFEKDTVLTLKPSSNHLNNTLKKVLVTAINVIIEDPAASTEFTVNFIDSAHETTPADRFVIASVVLVRDDFGIYTVKSTGTATCDVEIDKDLYASKIAKVTNADTNADISSSHCDWGVDARSAFKVDAGKIKIDLSRLNGFALNERSTWTANINVYVTLGELKAASTEESKTATETGTTTGGKTGGSDPAKDWGSHNWSGNPYETLGISTKTEGTTITITIDSETFNKATTDQYKLQQGVAGPNTAKDKPGVVGVNLTVPDGCHIENFYFDGTRYKDTTDSWRCLFINVTEKATADSAALTLLASTEHTVSYVGVNDTTSAATQYTWTIKVVVE